MEVSFRPRHPDDRTIIQDVPGKFVEEYGITPVSVCRYVLEAAVRQKIDALGGRREAQARDVFDLHASVGRGFGEDLLAFLAGGLERGRLSAAHKRALSIAFAEYEGQVIEFLAADAREKYGSKDKWDEVRLETAMLIEAVIERSEES